jgi:hypothetical protein
MLAEAVQERLKFLDPNWGQSCGAAIRDAMQYISRAAKTMKPTPQGVRTMAGAIKLMGELEQMKQLTEAKLAQMRPSAPVQPIITVAGEQSLKRTG